MWGTLRVVTARELVILSGSLTSHSKSARWLRHFTWSCEPQEMHSLQCWRARNKSPQAYPACTGDWTQGHRATGAHATTCTIATLLLLLQVISVPRPTNPQFTKWRGSTVHNVVEMTHFTKLTFKRPNLVISPWQTSTVPGLHRTAWKTWRLYELDADCAVHSKSGLCESNSSCRKQWIVSPEYLFPRRKQTKHYPVGPGEFLDVPQVEVQAEAGKKSSCHLVHMLGRMLESNTIQWTMTNL